MAKNRFSFLLAPGDYKRVVIICFTLFLFFCFLIVQFYKLQIVEGEKWAKQASFQHKRTIVQPFTRGRFFSNNTISKNHLEEGVPFVLDVVKFHLFIDPKSIPIEEKEKISAKLCSFFHLPVKEKTKATSQFYKNSRCRKLMPWLDSDKKKEVENWWSEYIKNKKIPSNAIFFVQDFKRAYPFGSLLGQLLHTVQDEKDINLQGIPTGGVELYFNEYLQGKLGKKEIIKSPTHPIGLSNIINDVENGADIYLTINQYIQAIVEEELEKGVKKLNAKSGWAIMMDPTTGEILALGQYPFFDIGKYSKYFNEPSLVEHTKLKAVTDAFEPASIFKPITLAICFKANQELLDKGEEPLFSPMEKVNTSSGAFPGRTRPIKDGRRHNYLNMYLAIQKSSNVYMGQIVKRVIDRFGDDWYKKQLHEMFGFGEKTKIEYPGENPGLVPTPGKMHPNGTLEWSLSTPYSLAMGHNILVNSIQIIKGFGIIANYGLDVQPTLVRKIVKVNEKGEEVVVFNNDENRKIKKRRRIIDRASAAQLINAMKFTTKLGGTALHGDVMGYSEAGKSGTSEKIIDGKYSDRLYLSSFVGIAPARNAKFVLMVVIDEPEKKFISGIGKSWHGGVCASPIFSSISKRTLQYLGVEPDDPFGYSYGDPRSNRKKADWANEVTQMRKLYQYWNDVK